MRRMTTPWCGVPVAFATVVFFLLVARVRTAAAQRPEPADLIEGASACPEPSAVWSELSALVVIDDLAPRLRRLAGGVGGAHPVDIADLGAAFRVRAGDRTREYHD